MKGRNELRYVMVGSLGDVAEGSEGGHDLKTLTRPRHTDIHILVRTFQITFHMQRGWPSLDLQPLCPERTATAHVHMESLGYFDILLCSNSALTYKCSRDYGVKNKQNLKAVCSKY